MSNKIKLQVFFKDFANQKFSVLDVGCGNHSVRIFKRFFKKCHYYGVDKDVYNNDESDFNLMEKFYKIDLSKNDLSEITNDQFNLINMFHVLEHLPNGLEVIEYLLPKLKSGGKLYLEFPGRKALALPSAEGTLNFCDDATHVRVYSIEEICNCLLAKKFKIIRAGTRYSLLHIILSPLLFLRSIVPIIFGKKLEAKGLWYILGFSDYVYAEKL